MLDVKSLQKEAVKHLDCDNMSCLKTGARSESLFVESFFLLCFVLFCFPAMHCKSLENVVDGSLAVVPTPHIL